MTKERLKYYSNRYYNQTSPESTSSLGSTHHRDRTDSLDDILYELINELEREAE